MRVAADDQIDRGIETIRTLLDAAGEVAATGIVELLIAGAAAFVNEHHDGLDSTPLQLGNHRVRCRSLITERETGRAIRNHHRRSSTQHESDERHCYARVART